MTHDVAGPSVASAGSTGKRHEFQMRLDTSGFHAAVKRIGDAFRKAFGRQKSYGPLFSARLRMTRAAVAWCEDEGVHPTPFNIVTALSSLGLLEEQKRIKERIRR
jgi:hypothetical protein